MPVHIQVHYTDGNFDDQLVMVERQRCICWLIIKNHQPVAFVLFDPEFNGLCKSEFPQGICWIKNSGLFNVPNMMDRYDALVQTRTTSIDEKREDLIRLYEKKILAFATIIAQLSNDDNKKSMKY